jgi:hypothetical protein
MKKLLVFMLIVELIIASYFFQNATMFIYSIVMAIVAIWALTTDSKMPKFVLGVGSAITALVGLWAIVYTFRLITVGDTYSLVVPTEAKFAGMFGLLTFALSMTSIAVIFMAKKKYEFITFNTFK